MSVIHALIHQCYGIAKRDSLPTLRTISRDNWSPAAYGHAREILNPSGRHEWYCSVGSSDSTRTRSYKSTSIQGRKMRAVYRCKSFSSPASRISYGYQSRKASRQNRFVAHAGVLVSYDHVLPDGKRLEILRMDPDTPNDQSTPVLFVHGVAHAGWCWAEHFMPFFAEAGFKVYAVSMRGHVRH